MGLTERELCPHQEAEPQAAKTFALQPEQAPWFALVVRHQHERTTQAALASKMFPSLVPVYKVRNRWSDRTKELEVPLFGSYVFCRFTRRDRASVLTTPGVRAVVGFGGVPAAIDASEIDAIQAMVASGLPVGPWPHLKPGDAVRVERGPLRGLTGTLVRERDRFRIVIGIELLQRSIAAELSPDMITPIRRS